MSLFGAAPFSNHLPLVVPPLVVLVVAPLTTITRGPIFPSSPRVTPFPRVNFRYVSPTLRFIYPPFLSSSSLLSPFPFSLPQHVTFLPVLPLLCFLTPLPACFFLLTSFCMCNLYLSSSLPPTHSCFFSLVFHSPVSILLFLLLLSAFPSVWMTCNTGLSRVLPLTVFQCIVVLPSLINNTFNGCSISKQREWDSSMVERRGAV